MKKILMLTFSFFITNQILAKDILIKTTLDAGLLPIPKSTKELDKIILQKAKDVKDNPTTKDKIELGKKLFFEPRLSKSGMISCHTCHNLALAGADMVSTPHGHNWLANPNHLNSPTVFNSVLNDVQFWDGRAKDLTEQAKGPLLTPHEMAATAGHITDTINSIPEYVSEFKKAYGKKVNINLDLIASTIAVFERTLITPSRFDDFLNGNSKALSKKEKQGLKLFLETGCTMCHNGINIGAGMRPFQVATKYKHADVGGFKGNEFGEIKAPSLRNVALTPPYFHNGVIWSLQEAIKTMGEVQLEVKLEQKEIELIEAFLQSLNGRFEPIKHPILPPRSDKTPKPDFK